MWPFSKSVVQHPLWELLNPSARRALELACEDARRCGQEYVGREHLISAIAKEAGEAEQKLMRRVGAEGVITRVGSGEHAPAEEPSPFILYPYQTCVPTVGTGLPKTFSLGVTLGPLAGAAKSDAATTRCPAMLAFSGLS